MDFKNILKKASFEFTFNFRESVLNAKNVILFLLAFPLNMNKIFLILLLLIGLETTAFAQTGQVDFLRSTGMIYCVIAVIAIVIIGLAMYLMRIEKKINKLEKKYNNG